MNSNIFKPPFVPFISVLLITTLVALFNIPIMNTLWRYSFDDGTYSHAYLVPFIVGYLFYDLSVSNKLIFREKISWFAFGLLLFSAYLLFVTSTSQISLGYWLATLLLLCVSVNFLFKANIKTIFPALYFIFLIPVWGILSVPLQNISVSAVNTLMGFTSIPVFVEDQFVHIPSGVFEIAGGCSGLRYLLTSLAISSLFTFLYLRTLKNVSIFVSIAIFGALLTNWLRITILIIIGHQTKMTSSLMADHNMFGWYLYIPFMFLLFKLGGYLNEKETKTNQATPKEKIKSTINWKVATVLFAGLLLSSTSLTMSHIKKSELINAEIQPLIHYYSTVNVITSNVKTTHLIYNFDGKNLEEKPTFFENNFIPDGWQVLAQNSTNDSTTIEIEKGLNSAVIIISYEISDKKVGSSAKFKLERLKQALVGIRATKLHWQFQLN